MRDCLFSHYDGQKFTIENIDDYVKRICGIENGPGMSIVVLDNQQEDYINVGYADKNKKSKMTNEIRCELGFTTTYNGKETTITIEHLLCHTSDILT